MPVFTCIICTPKYTSFGMEYQLKKKYFFFSENQKTNQSTHPQEMSMEQLKHLLGQVMNNRMMKKKIKQR